VKSVEEEIIIQRKTKRLIQKSFKLENIVNFVENILFIKRQNFKKVEG